jgi:hypothetical protein
MKTRGVRWLAVGGLLMAICGAGAAAVAWAAQEGATGGTPVSMLVSVEAKHGKEVPAVASEDVNVFQGSTKDRVTGWVPLTGDQAALQLYVLVDDSIESSIALQFKDARAFMDAQPPTTEIAVGYMRNGTVDQLQNFTADHALAGKALRLPMGAGAGGPSPYLSVSDLIKHWPESSGRREILMISDGVDELQEGAVNSYLDATIQDAQRAGVQVYSIYASGAGHLGHAYWRINWGQYDLSRLTDQTGGEAYFQGFQTPVSFGPYLGEFAERLKHQYKLTFLAAPGKKAGFERVKLETGVPNAQLVGASNVYVPQ